MRTIFEYLIYANMGRVISLLILLLLSAVAYNITNSDIAYGIFLGFAGIFCLGTASIILYGFYSSIKTLFDKKKK